MNQMLGSSTPDGLAPLGNLGILIIMMIFCIGAILWGLVNGISLVKSNPLQQQSAINERGSDGQKLIDIFEMCNKIMKGTMNFLKYTFIVCLITIIIMYLIILGAIESFSSFYISTAFIIGSINAILCTIFVALLTHLAYPRICNAARLSTSSAYQILKYATNFQSFFLIGWNTLLISLFLLIYERQLQKFTQQQIQTITQAIIGYSLGTALVNIIIKSCSTIYSKGSQSALFFMRKLDDRLPKDSKNPLIIAKAIGQSLNKNISASLNFITYLSAGITVTIAAAGQNVIGADQQGQIIFDIAINNIYLPIIAIGFSIGFAIIFNILFNFILPNSKSQEIRFCFTMQQVVTFILLLGFFAEASYLCLPVQFEIKQIGQHLRHPYHAYLCLILGMISSFILMFSSQVITNSPFFVDTLFQSCKTGAATSIIYGLSFGYMFNVVPVALFAGLLFISSYWLGIFGVSLFGIGYISLMPIYFIISTFYSMTQNCSMISFICKLSDDTVNTLVVLNTNKKNYQPHLQGYFNGSLIIFGYALALNFILFQNTTSLKYSHPLVFAGLLVGSMYPYAFISLITKGIQNVYPVLCYDLKAQIQDMPGILKGQLQPDYNRTTQLYAFFTVKQLRFIAPILIIIPMFVFGFLGGPKFISGFVVAIAISGVQISISSGISGLMWTSVKNQISLGNVKDQEQNVVRSDSQWGRAAQVSAEVGTPLKDSISTILPGFTIFLGLLCSVMGNLFTKIHS